MLGCQPARSAFSPDIVALLPTWPAVASNASASFLLPEVLPVATNLAVLTTRLEKFTNAADFESNTWWEGW